MNRFRYLHGLAECVPVSATDPIAPTPDPGYEPEAPVAPVAPVGPPSMTVPGQSPAVPWGIIAAVAVALLTSR